jgi:hypothetical protein
MYISMKVAMLAQGPNALPVETVDALSASNAYQLAKLPAEKRTADVVKKAQTQSRNTFVATVQSIKNDALPVEKQRDPKVDFFRRLHPGVAEKLEETIRRFCKLPVIKDGIFDMTLEEKAIYAMCCAAEQNCQEELRAAEEVERRGSPTIPITETKEAPATEPEILEEVRTADFSAPDFPTVAAAAEAEGRVVPIKRTHLQ